MAKKQSSVSVSLSESHHDGLSNFDLLPNSAYVRQPVVEGLFACKPSTVWEWVKKGLIPTPRKLSPGVTGWNVGELRKRLKEIQAC